MEKTSRIILLTRVGRGRYHHGRYRLVSSPISLSQLTTYTYERHRVNRVQAYPMTTGESCEGEGVEWRRGWSWRIEGRRGGWRGSFAFELAFEPATTSLHPPFRKNGQTFGHPPPSPGSPPPPDSHRECGLLGYHRRRCARPSPLPEAFPTNCSSERTTTKTMEDPEPPESVILLRWAQKFRRRLADTAGYRTFRGIGYIDFSRYPGKPYIMRLCCLSLGMNLSRVYMWNNKLFSHTVGAYLNIYYKLTFFFFLIISFHIVTDEYDWLNRRRSSCFTRRFKGH